MREDKALKGMSVFNHTPSRLVYLLGICTVIEAVLFGSGQLLKAGPLTVKMILYMSCLCVSAWICVRLRPRFDSTDVRLIILYFLLFLLDIGLGLVNQAPGGALVEDIKPLSYFFIFPFFLVFITSMRTVDRINSLFRYLPLIMAVIYLVYLMAVSYLGIFTFGQAYESAGQESDFMFRGKSGELFYKGFIFLPIGMMFWVEEKKILPVIIIAIAIYYTRTRGFYIISLFGCIVYYFLTSNNRNAKRAVLLCGILMVIGLIAIRPDLNMGGEDDRTGGDQIRWQTMSQVWGAIDGFSLWIGHGFGNGVPVRPIHMENSFLEIFQKSGLLGLAYWLYFLFCIYRNIRCLKGRRGTKVPKLYFVGVLMVYVQSLFNPFITNPIGMSFVLISYCVIKFYRNDVGDTHRLCRI